MHVKMVDSIGNENFSKTFFHAIKIFYSLKGFCSTQIKVLITIKELKISGEKLGPVFKIFWPVCRKTQFRENTQKGERVRVVSNSIKLHQIHLNILLSLSLSLSTFLSLSLCLIFNINKPNMKKNLNLHYFHCFRVCILVLMDFGLATSRIQ